MAELKAGTGRAHPLSVFNFGFFNPSKKDKIMTTKPHIKIMILEDNDFYNKLITKYLKTYLEQISLIKGFTFEISSFTTFDDCSRNLKPDIDIIISDYYLNDGYSVMDLLELIKKQERTTNVIVISKSRDLKNSIGSLSEGADEYVYKDNEALRKSAYIVEEMIIQNLNKRFMS